MGQFRIIAKTFHGLEPILEKEVEALGGKEISKGKRLVEFTGDQEMLYRANIQLRTALRVLKPIFSFHARSDRALYTVVKKHDWSQLMNVDQTIAIDSVVNQSEWARHSNYASLKVKDAIADQFREKTDRRPTVDHKNANIRINLHIYKDDCSISLDSSGSSLHKRNYRDGKHPAPMNEVLAAGLVLLSGWDMKMPFMDPFCGSGTIAIEAGMAAYNIPPAWHHMNFAFKNWADFDKALFEKVVEDCKSKIALHGPKIFASDISPIFVRQAKENAAKAGLAGKIEIERKRFDTIQAPYDNGVMIMNPPYEMRMSTETDVMEFYKKIGDKLKQEFEGWEAWVFSGNIPAIKNVGLKASRKIQLYNGPIDSRYHQFELYQGSREESEEIGQSSEEE